MSDIYSRLDGTTTDRFKIGRNNQRVILTGQTNGAVTTDLVDRYSLKHTTNSTAFFTAYIVGKGNELATFEIKGCYIYGTSTVAGFVTNTYSNTADFPEPTVAFNFSGELTLQCTGVAGDNVSWTAIVDFVLV